MDSDIKFKAILYAIPLFLTPFADKIISVLFTDKWPSLQMVAGCTILGIIASSLGLRMYFDGSYERSKNGNGKNGVTPPTVPPPTVPPITPPTD
jgi:hypothetical protein